METVATAQIAHYIQHRAGEPWHIHVNWQQTAVCGTRAIRYIHTATPPKDNVPDDLCPKCRERYGLAQLRLINGL